MPEQPPQSSLTDYVMEIRTELYGTWRTRRRIAEEFRGHLEDSVSTIMRSGLSRPDAERTAIERFGPPAVVARSLANARGIGIPTEFTRWGGISALIGAVSLAVTLIWQELSWSFSHGAYAEASFAPKVLFAFGVMAMYRRVRGNLGVWGRRGFQLVLVGMVVGFVSSLAWYPPGGWVGVAAMALGLGAYLTAMVRAKILPTGGLAVLAGAVGATFAIGVAGTIAGSDTGTEALFVGSIGVAVAMSWLGAWLWAEQKRPEATSVTAPALSGAN